MCVSGEAAARPGMSGTVPWVPRLSTTRSPPRAVVVETNCDRP
jgi:hypothetical protein